MNTDTNHKAGEEVKVRGDTDQGDLTTKVTKRRETDRSIGFIRIKFECPHVLFLSSLSANSVLK